MPDAEREPETAARDHVSADGGSTVARVATVVFAVAVAVAGVLYMVRGSEQSFWLDEWDFFADRSATVLDDLLRPHNEHWSTLPILVYRALWQVFGLRSYVPYQIVIVGLHLVAAVLVFIVMRRSRVHPVIAVATASVFLFFGTGRNNIVWAFQIGFVGALVCGLVQLVLADHDGPITRRDVAGLVFGVAALLCSGIGVITALAVGVATFLRRGWKVAAFHIVPLAALYAVWWFGYASDRTETEWSIDRILRFARVGIANAFDAMGQIPGVGVVLGVLLVGGLVLAFVSGPSERVRTTSSVPIAMLAAGVLFFAVTATGRTVLGEDAPKAGRYAYIFVALALPALAVAAQAVYERWHAALPVIVVVMLLGVPGNIDAIEASGPDRLTLGGSRMFEIAAHSPYVTRVPGSVHPFGFNGSEVTVRWLRRGAASGRIPEPDAVRPAERAAVGLRLLLDQRPEERRDTDVGCRPLPARDDHELETGDVIRGRGTYTLQLVEPDGTTSDPVDFVVDGDELVAVAGPLQLRSVGPLPGTAVLCRAP
jgi:hypothetical protein